MRLLNGVRTTRQRTNVRDTRTRSAAWPQRQQRPLRALEAFADTSRNAEAPWAAAKKTERQGNGYLYRNYVSFMTMSAPSAEL